MAEVLTTSSGDKLLRRLMNEYEITIRRVCYIYLQDAHLVEDAAQETFLRAYLSWEKFNGMSSEKTWLIRIAINVCHNMRRSGWMRYVDRRIMLDQLPEPISEASYSMIELTIDIMKLPSKLLDVVMLHDYQGFTVRETGMLLGITHQTVVNRLRKAHHQLRISLEGGNQDDSKEGRHPKGT